MKIININSLQHCGMVSSITGEAYSESAELSPLFGLKDIVVHHEILTPGRRSSAPHYHTLREEMVLVLTGYPICKYGNKTVEMEPGDTIGFKPGLSERYYFENATNELVHLLVICSNPIDDSVIY